MSSKASHEMIFHRYRAIRIATALIFLLTSGSFHDAAETAQSTPPHYPRQGTNLLSNFDLSGTAGWTFSGDAAYDAEVSRTPGSGSMRLTSTYESPSKSIIVSDFIPVKPGKVYTFSTYMKTSTWPAAASTFIAVFDSSKTSKGNCCGSRQMTTNVDIWEETAIFYKAKPGDAYVKLKVTRVESPRDDGHIWLDDIYFGEGPGFEQAPTEKVAFEGAMVRIDELGNFEVLQDGIWTPFFPFCIYQDNSKPSYQAYSDQGLNCVMFNQLSTIIPQKAKEAVSPLNPEGMMAMGAISYWMQPNKGGYGDIDGFTTKLEKLVSSPQIDNLLAFYWDNEARDQYGVPKQITDMIKATDVDQFGQRLHPIYMLQGQEGMARAYNDMVDSVGTYVVGGMQGYWGGEVGFPVLDNIEGQRNPLGIGVITASDRITRTAGGFRTYFYNLLISGAKGAAYYRDPTHYDNVPLETLPVWSEFRNIRQEIDQLLPLIRQPHWTTWKAISTSTGLHLGTREYDGEGYLIVVNPSGSSVSTTLTISGLVYTAEAAYDYFTGERVAEVSNDSFQITLQGYGTAVLRLKRGKTAQCQPDLNRDGTVDQIDVQVMANQILTGPSGGICADLNADGLVDIQDLQSLVNIILELN